MKGKRSGSMIMMIILAVIMIIGCGGNESSNTTGADGAAFTELSADDLKQMMASDGNLVIIDVREKYEFEGGHISGSVMMPMSEIKSRVNELAKDKKIVVVCASSSRSPVAADYLVKNGYTNVYNLSGGLMSWKYGLE